MGVPFDPIDQRVIVTTAVSSGVGPCTAPADPRDPQVALGARGEQIPRAVADEMTRARGDAITPIMVAGQRTAIRRRGVFDNSTQAPHGWFRHGGTGHAAMQRGGDGRK